MRPDQHQALAAEAALFQNIAARHANVIKLIGLVDGIDSDGVPFYGFVMPRLCDVRDAIRDPECDLTQRLAWIADVASGLAFLHENGVVHGHLQVCVRKRPVCCHRDVSLCPTRPQASNVLIELPALRTVICDLSFEKVMRGARSTGESIAVSSFIACSSRWNAPELQADPRTGLAAATTPTTSSDVWAFATTAWEIITGRIPYADLPGDITEGRIAYKIFNEGATPALAPLDDAILYSFVCILDQCWSKVPESRPSMATVAELLMPYRT